MITQINSSIKIWLLFSKIFLINVFALRGDIKTLISLGKKEFLQIKGQFAALLQYHFIFFCFMN